MHQGGGEEAEEKGRVRQPAQQARALPLLQHLLRVWWLLPSRPARRAVSSFARMAISFALESVRAEICELCHGIE